MVQSDTNLTLYVATSDFPDRSQYTDSQKLLKSIGDNGLVGRIRIIDLDSLDRHRSYFDTINVPDKKTRLPFLECIYSGEMSVILGYSGLEDIAEELSRLGLG